MFSMSWDTFYNASWFRPDSSTKPNPPPKEKRSKGLAPLPLSPSRCRSTPHRKCSWHLGHQADGFDSELREMLGRLRGDWWQRRVLVVLLQ